jgi:hypothetical protein
VRRARYMRLDLLWLAVSCIEGRRLRRWGTPKKLHGVKRGPRRSVPAVPTGMVAGGVVFFGAASASVSSRLGNGREPGVEAKLCELDDKAFGPEFL